jgi:hypothetical protein
LLAKVLKSILCTEMALLRWLEGWGGAGLLVWSMVVAARRVRLRLVVGISQDQRRVGASVGFGFGVFLLDLQRLRV